MHTPALTFATSVRLPGSPATQHCMAGTSKSVVVVAPVRTVRRGRARSAPKCATMPSVFPGMDPYIEAQIWTDFHTELVSGIRAAIQPLLRPLYVALIEHRVYVERAPDEQPGSMTPDVTVVDAAPGGQATVSRPTGVISPVLVPLPMSEEVREPYLTVRLPDTMEVVTVIELLSPGNKRPGSEGRREYLAKREAVLKSAVHLIEIDLLRGGARVPMAAPLPSADYYVVISRAPRRPLAEVWPVPLRQPLPAVPVPLADPDADVLLDLQQVMDASFERGDYGRVLDYTRNLQPPINERDVHWVQQVLQG